MFGVSDKVRQIIIDKLGVGPAEVTSTASFVEDLGVDSLDRVELVMALEEAFYLEIPDEVVDTMVTVQDAIDYIVKNAKITKQ